MKGTLAARPIVIIGAGRSGTNMLRDVLTGRQGFHTWPCDEINYIWRHGNREWPTDEFPATFATTPVKRYIRQRFDQIAKSQGSSSDEFTVEKTCANSLRVPFVDAVLPQARYIHLIRDGRNVVASALQRWQAPLDLQYLIAKAKYIPISDVPHYATKYLRNRLHKIRRGSGTLSTWGPRFDGMAALSPDLSLETLCALQWRRCVERATEAFEQIDDSRVLTLKYEQVIADPASALALLDTFLEFDSTAGERTEAVQSVRMKPLVQQRVQPLKEAASLEIASPLLERLMYL